MAQPKSPKPKQPDKDTLPTESGFEKRLADMYKKVLHTPCGASAAIAKRLSYSMTDRRCFYTVHLQQPASDQGFVQARLIGETLIQSLAPCRTPGPQKAVFPFPEFQRRQCERQSARSGPTVPLSAAHQPTGAPERKRLVALARPSSRKR